MFRPPVRKKNSTGPPPPIQPVTREYDQNVFRNSAPNNYSEPHETEKVTPEFNGRPEPRIQSPSQNEDGQTTKLLQSPANAYFTYNRVPWKLNVRKEVSLARYFIIWRHHCRPTWQVTRVHFCCLILFFSCPSRRCSPQKNRCLVHWCCIWFSVK